VCDTDTFSPGRAASRLVTRLVFPAPDGAEMTNSLPMGCIYHIQFP